MISLLLALVLAPALQGLVKTTKANLQMRQGPPLLQPYADLWKLLRKGVVVPETSTWIFPLAPWVVLAATLVAAGLVPTVGGAAFRYGDAILFAGLLAVARFALALAALDTASNFAGMGASRDMGISALVEPALIGGLFALAVPAGTTDLPGLVYARSLAPAGQLDPSTLLALIALLIVAIAETGRVPVDNPDTHLELTMVHEAMLLEYSGRPLGLLHLASQVKQVAVLGLIGALFVPWTLAAAPALALGAFVAKLIALGLALALIETVNAKLRILRVADLLATAAGIGGLSLVARAVFGS
jgi:formate hydrogenlyase subunit 4